MRKKSLLYRLLEKIGLIKTYEISKKSMCESAKSICNKDCKNCAWYE